MPTYKLRRLKKIKTALTVWWRKYDRYLLTMFSLLGIGALIIGVGALFGWPLMVGLLVSVGLPLLALKITLTVVGSILVLGSLAYGIKRLRQGPASKVELGQKSAHESFKQMNKRQNNTTFNPQSITPPQGNLRAQVKTSDGDKPLPTVRR